MLALSDLLDPTAGDRVAPRRQVEADDDRISLACVCAVSAVGLALGLIAAFGPMGADAAIATALIAALGGAGVVGLGFGLAAVLDR